MVQEFKADQKLTLIEFSLGGVITTEFAKGDQHTGVVANIDGGINNALLSAKDRAPFIPITVPTQSI